VQVAGHDGKSVHAPTTAKRGFAEVFLKPIAVDVIAYNVLSAIAAAHEVVDCARLLEAQVSWHAFYGNILAVGSQEKTGA
jgi:hypothetical protein